MSGWLLDNTTVEVAQGYVGERYYPARILIGYYAVFIDVSDKETTLTTGAVREIGVAHGVVHIKTDDGVYSFYTLADDEVAP